jgi:phage terminase small subunit
MPTAELPPDVLIEEQQADNPEWLELWKSTLKVLKKQGTWKPELRPQLEAYVNYLRLAKQHRAAAEGNDFTEHPESGRVFAHPGFALARDAEREARALAEVLVLTPTSRRAHGIDDDPEGDDFDL